MGVAVSNPTDRQFLLGEQYCTGSNLNARIRLHELYSTNRYGWHRWVFDQLSLEARSRILELGCGTGSLWLSNRDRMPKGWHVTLTDLSLGMVADARRSLGADHSRWLFTSADAQSIPFATGSFDAVIANHMLHHLPERDRAFAEIKRVLRPGDRLYASTVGHSHLRELSTMLAQANLERLSSWGEAFCLENGAEQLERWFGDVDLRRYEDALVITEAEPLLAYVKSSGIALDEERMLGFTQAVCQELATHGAIRVTKDSGIFACRRDCSA
jgi:SAM-dependent methyltransferase